jgi:hypothetical protein
VAIEARYVDLAFGPAARAIDGEPKVFGDARRADRGREPGPPAGCDGIIPLLNDLERFGPVVALSLAARAFGRFARPRLLAGVARLRFLAGPAGPARALDAAGQASALSQASDTWRRWS